MIRSVNLPVFQDELVDGGLQVSSSNITTDVLVVIGFHANGYVGQGATPKILTYILIPQSMLPTVTQLEMPPTMYMASRQMDQQYHKQYTSQLGQGQIKFM